MKLLILTLALIFSANAFAASARILDCTVAIDADVPNSVVVNTMARYSMPTLTFSKKDSADFAVARGEYTLKDARGKALAVIATDSFLRDDSGKAADITIMIKDSGSSSSGTILLSKDGYDSEALELTVPVSPKIDAVIKGSDTSDFSDQDYLDVQVNRFTVFCSLR